MRNGPACPLAPGRCMCRPLAEACAMTSACYASLQWQRLHTFLQLFLCFLRRGMVKTVSHRVSDLQQLSCCVMTEMPIPAAGNQIFLQAGRCPYMT